MTADDSAPADESSEMLQDPEDLRSLRRGAETATCGPLSVSEVCAASADRTDWDTPQLKPPAGEGARLGHQESTPIQKLVSDLNGHLGATLVAALADARHSKEPYVWERGDTPPSAASEPRLRLAYRLWHAVAAAESGDVARAFFIGKNPILDDDTIITLLRRDRFSEAQAAVHAFLTDTWTG